MRRGAAGEILADELAARQWTPAILAAVCKLPEQAITAILAGGPITPSVAERIGQALGTSAQMWLALDAHRAQPLPHGPTGIDGHITGAHMPRLETLDPRAIYDDHTLLAG